MDYKLKRWQFWLVLLGGMLFSTVFYNPGLNTANDDVVGFSISVVIRFAVFSIVMIGRCNDIGLRLRHVFWMFIPGALLVFGFFPSGYFSRSKAALIEASAA